MRDGAEIKLTPKEFELIAFLARHAGKVLTHRQILRDVWGPAHEHDTQYLRVYVGQLRNKLEADPANPALIVTEPGIPTPIGVPTGSIPASFATSKTSARVSDRTWS